MNGKKEIPQVFFSFFFFPFFLLLSKIYLFSFYNHLNCFNNHKYDHYDHNLNHCGSIQGTVGLRCCISYGEIFYFSLFLLYSYLNNICSQNHHYHNICPTSTPTPTPGWTVLKMQSILSPKICFLFIAFLLFFFFFFFLNLLTFFTAHLNHLNEHHLHNHSATSVLSVIPMNIKVATTYLTHHKNMRAGNTKTQKMQAKLLELHLWTQVLVVVRGIATRLLLVIGGHMW